jgi:hypothetical protein
MRAEVKQNIRVLQSKIRGRKGMAMVKDERLNKNALCLETPERSCRERGKWPGYRKKNDQQCDGEK